MSDQRHDAVSRRAYELWQQEGGSHGRHDDHWHRAAREIDDADRGEGDDVAVDSPQQPAAPIATAAELLGDEPRPAAGQSRRRTVKAASEVPASATAAASGKAPAKPRKSKAK